MEKTCTRQNLLNLTVAKFSKQMFMRSGLSDIQPGSVQIFKIENFAATVNN